MPDLQTAPIAAAEDEAVNGDFLHFLVRGAELLHAGTAEQARSTLEQALKLSPHNQRGQNLLALSYFKLGLFERAEELYRKLADEHPDDVSLKVNLGLVHLKRAQSDEAIKSLLAALHQAPDHAKAANYLGLAFMQKHDYAEAKLWFERAGNATMIEKVSALERDLAPPPQESTPRVEMHEAPRSMIDFQGGSVEMTAAPGRIVAEPTMPPPPVALSSQLMAISAAIAPPALVAMPFEVTTSVISLQIDPEMFVRLDGLLAVFGTVDFKPAFKRFRARVTEKPFGEPGRRMMHASGKGKVCVAPAGRTFTIFEVGDDPAYVREDVLFAFEESLVFENGRVPSQQGADLQLVHLRNRGRLLLVSRNEPFTMDVKKDEPCRVQADVLLGWTGNITPRLVAIADEATPEGLAMNGVELTGEGRVMLDAAV
jgi:uncharacterized protein (AIM24 family)